MVHQETQVSTYLHQLVLEARKYPLGNLKRQQCLTQAMRLMEQSDQLWHEDTPYYEEALLHTWRYFGHNIGDVPTKKKRDLESSSVIAWFNRSLKSHLRNYAGAWQTQPDPVNTQNSNPTGETQKTATPIGAKPNQSFLEKTRKWVESDLDGELRRNHILNRPEVNCQVLILRRLPPVTSWGQLSAEFDLDVSKLSEFFQRQCLPRLSKFGEGIC